MSITADDLVARLQRICVAIGQTVDRDMSEYRALIHANEASVFIDFRGDMTVEEIENFAWSAIHNV